MHDINSILILNKTMSLFIYSVFRKTQNSWNFYQFFATKERPLSGYETIFIISGVFICLLSIIYQNRNYKWKTYGSVFILNGPD